MAYSHNTVIARLLSEHQKGSQTSEIAKFFQRDDVIEEIRDSLQDARKLNAELAKARTVDQGFLTTQVYVVDLK